MGQIEWNSDVALDFRHYRKHLIFGMTNGEEVDVGQIDAVRVINNDMIKNPQFVSWIEHFSQKDPKQFILLYYFEPVEYQYTRLEKLIASPAFIFHGLIAGIPFLDEWLMKVFFKIHQVEFFIILERSKLQERGREIYIDDVQDYSQTNVERHTAYEYSDYDSAENRRPKLTHILIEFAPPQSTAKLAKENRELRALNETLVAVNKSLRSTTRLQARTINMLEESLKSRTTGHIKEQEENYARIDKVSQGVEEEEER